MYSQVPVIVIIDDMEVVKFLKKGAENVSGDLTGYRANTTQTSIVGGYTLYQEYDTPAEFLAAISA